MLKIIFRNIARKPVYSAITFAGFAIAFAASLLIYLWVTNELSFDRFHPDYRRIYRVLTLARQGTEIVKSARCYRPVAKTIKADYDQVESATYLSYSSEDSPLRLDSGGEKIEARSCWTNDDFFKVFRGFEFLEGSPEGAFNDPDNIVLTEETAKKLFDGEKSLGKTVISDKYGKEVYKVSAVIRIPDQSHIDFGYMLSEKTKQVAFLADHWGDGNWVRVYIKLGKDAKTDDDLIDRISGHITRYSGKADKLLFQPLADVHLRSDYSDFLDHKPGSMSYVLIFSALAILIMLMASMNFSALSVARASERSVEIGIKKTVGGSRLSIFIQFIKESLMHIFAAALAAMIIVWLILPFFSTISSQELRFNFSFRFYFNLLLLILLTGCIAGVYPALYLSSFNPAGIFRRGSVSGSRSGFIRILVTVQFAIAAFFIISVMLFMKQLSFIHNKDLGIEDKNIVVIGTGLWYDNRQFKEELLRNPDVISASASTTAPVDAGYKQGLSLSHQGLTDTLQVNNFFVDEDFAKTYDLKVVRGQFLQMTNSVYWEESEKAGKSKMEGKEYVLSIPIVINETVAKLLEFEDPVGQRLGNNVIVGVVKDFHFQTMHHPIGPLIMSNNPEAINTMNIRITPGNTRATLDYIRDVYMKNRDNREFSYTFFDDILNSKYEPETRLKNITAGLGIIAVAISIMGILGMAVFSTERRTKEIGMRKVSGATSGEILLMVNGELIEWVMIAFVIAAPVAWILLNKWLSNFSYKTGLSWWIFALAGFIVFLIATITITWQSWRAANRNPVEALRYE